MCELKPHYLHAWSGAERLRRRRSVSIYFFPQPKTPNFVAFHNSGPFVSHSLILHYTCLEGPLSRRIALNLAPLPCIHRLSHGGCPAFSYITSQARGFFLPALTANSGSDPLEPTLFLAETSGKDRWAVCHAANFRNHALRAYTWARMYLERHPFKSVVLDITAPLDSRFGPAILALPSLL